MLVLKTEINVQGVAAKDVFNFMLNCTDEDYQKWWPGTHLAFHTINRNPNNVGNLVYFDEYIGERRLRFKAVVTEAVSGKKIVWQMKKLLRLPARVILTLEDRPESLLITHTLYVGFQGVGACFDPLLKIFLTTKFSHDLDKHAKTEFQKLVEILTG